MYELQFGRLENLEHRRAIIGKLEDRFQHSYILGSTGCGKSTLLVRMALYDIRQGLACIFVDPKGTHVREIYSLLTEEEREQRAVYYSYDHPALKLNPLRKKGYDIYDLVDEFTEAMDIIVSKVSSTNPPASDNMKEILAESIPLLKEEDREIETLYSFLRFEEVRNRYFAQHYRGRKTPFWEKVDKKIPGKINPILETADRVAVKLGKLIRPERYKALFEGENQYDPEDVTRNRKILLIDASGLTREKLFYVIGLFVFGLQSYCRRNIADRQPLMFYFDECWRGITDSFIELMPLVRSYKIGFTLAHQNIQQISPRRLIEVAAGECHTKIGFAQENIESARFMAGSFGLHERDFLQLEKYRAWVKIFTEKSLIKTYLPLLAEKTVKPPTRIKEQIIAKEQPKRRSFLRDSWMPVV